MARQYGESARRIHQSICIASHLVHCLTTSTPASFGSHRLYAAHYIFLANVLAFSTIGQVGVVYMGLGARVMSLSDR